MIVTDQIIIIDTKTVGGTKIKTECRRFEDGTWCVKHTMDGREDGGFYVVYPSMPADLLYGMFTGNYQGSSENRTKAAEVYVPAGRVVSEFNYKTEQSVDVFRSTPSMQSETAPEPTVECTVSAKQETMLDIVDDQPIETGNQELELFDESNDDLTPTDVSVEYRNDDYARDLFEGRVLIEQDCDDETYYSNVVRRIKAACSNRKFNFAKSFGTTRDIRNRLVDIDIIYRMVTENKMYSFTANDFLFQVHKNESDYDMTDVKYNHFDRRIDWWIKAGFLDNVGRERNGKVGHPNYLYSPTEKFQQVFTKRVEVKE